MNQKYTLPVRFRSRFEYTQAMAYVRAGHEIPNHLILWPTDPEYETAQFEAPKEDCGPGCQCGEKN